jgi:hypothetical protein
VAKSLTCLPVAERREVAVQLMLAAVAQLKKELKKAEQGEKRRQKQQKLPRRRHSGFH